MKILSTLFTVLLFSLSVAAQSPGEPMPNVIFYNRDASAFPTYGIPTGKQSLIIFFDATCEHCQRVVAEIDKHSKELQKINIYMVSQDEYRSIDYFTSHFAKLLSTQKNVKIVQDKDHAFIPAFHPKQYPGIYLYAPDKKLRLYSSNEKEVPKFFKLINP